MRTLYFCPVASSFFLFMVALWNRADHYIFVLWFFLSFFLSFFLLFSSPNLSRRRVDVCLPYLHTLCGLSANLRCRSERAARGSLKMQDAKNRHLRTIVQRCRAISSKLKHVSTIGKNLLSSNISSRRSHNMVNFGLIAAEIGAVVWASGHPS